MKSKWFFEIKKEMVVLGVAIMISSSCNTNKQDLVNTNDERDSLIAVLTDRDSTISDFLRTYTEIQQSLDSVAFHGTTIAKSMGSESGNNGTITQHINEDIRAINQLMKENRIKVANLNHKLSKLGTKNVQLSELIQTLNDQIVMKDCELDILNERLIKLNQNVITLQTNIDTITSKAAGLTNELHTAYYVIGEEKELSKKNIIDKEGGILGIRKTSKFNGNYENSNFIKIDYMQVKSIPVNSKEAKLITAHPENSYTIVKDAQKNITIKIEDPTKFWSASKYLVIVKD